MIEGLRPTEPVMFDVPRTTGPFGPFARPEQRRTLSPDDVELFRLLCGFANMTPGQMFRRLVRDEARRRLGTAKADKSAKTSAIAEAQKVFAATGRRTPVYEAPGRQENGGQS